MVMPRCTAGRALTGFFCDDHADFTLTTDMQDGATQSNAPGGSEIEIRVLDQGPGLAEEDLEHLFDLFYRSPLTAKKAPGAGIGLFVSNHLAQAMGGLALSPLVTGWMIAALLRLSVGSATVAVITAASIMAPIVGGLPNVNKELLVVAIGAGSLIASHVNDSGFWLVKEYLNMSVPQVLATWTVIETIISVAGLGGVLLLALVVG